MRVRVRARRCRVRHWLFFELFACRVYLSPTPRCRAWTPRRRWTLPSTLRGRTAESRTTTGGDPDAAAILATARPYTLHVPTSYQASPHRWSSCFMATGERFLGRDLHRPHAHLGQRRIPAPTATARSTRRIRASGTRRTDAATSTEVLVDDVQYFDRSRRLTCRPSTTSTPSGFCRDWAFERRFHEPPPRVRSRVDGCGDPEA